MNKKINLDLDEKYSEILIIVEKELSCSAHDLDHIMRVYNLCMLIATHEDQVNMNILIPSILLHDIARVREDKDTLGLCDHAVVGSEMAEDILRVLGYGEEDIKEIKHCIISHRYRSSSHPQTIEAKVLFDADKLDGIGATGIARSFMMVGQYGGKLYEDLTVYRESEENLLETSKFNNIIDKHSPNIEFEIKYKKVPESLYTKKAKEIAAERKKFMEKFFETLEDEVHGLR